MCLIRHLLIRQRRLMHLHERVLKFGLWSSTPRIGTDESDYGETSVIIMA